MTGAKPLDEFRAKVEEFISSTGMAPSTFGDKACKDFNFVADLRDGREPRFSTISKVEDFMERWHAQELPNNGQKRVNSAG